MKNLFASTLILLISLPSFSQTKLIAHKSNGGSNATFVKALKSDVELKGSNYGHAPEPFVLNAQLDSVIFIDDTTSVMVTSFVKDGSGSFRVTYDPCSRVDEDGNLLPWHPGRDTIFGHEIFSSGGSISEMQDALDNLYYFANEGKDVVFWNFPKQRLNKENKNGIPLFIFNPKGPWPWLGVLMLLVSVLGFQVMRTIKQTLA